MNRAETRGCARHASKTKASPLCTRPRVCLPPPPSAIIVPPRLLGSPPLSSDKERNTESEHSKEKKETSKKENQFGSLFALLLRLHHKSKRYPEDPSLRGGGFATPEPQGNIGLASESSTEDAELWTTDPIMSLVVVGRGAFPNMCVASTVRPARVITVAFISCVGAPGGGSVSIRAAQSAECSLVCGPKLCI